MRSWILGSSLSRSRSPQVAIYVCGTAAMVLGLLFAVSAFRGERPAAWQQAEHTLVADNHGSMSQLVIHVPAGGGDQILPMLQTLLPNLQKQTAADIICGDATECARLQQALRAWKVPRPERFRFVHFSRVATFWARDHYVAARSREGQDCLLTPPMYSVLRLGDHHVPELLASQGRNVKAEYAQVPLEGGDVLVGRRFVLAGWKTARDVRGIDMFLPEEETRSRLERVVGKPVIFLPTPADLPPGAGKYFNHLDYYVSVLQDDSVLLGDVDWGQRLAEQVTREGQGVCPDLKSDSSDSILVEHVRRQLAAVHRRLSEHGLRVHRVPLYIDPSRDLVLSYNNVLQDEVVPGRFRVYVPAYGANLLDQQGRAVYTKLGYDARPVDVRDLAVHRGALRCAVNVVRRAPPRPANPPRPAPTHPSKKKASPPRTTA